MFLSKQGNAPSGQSEPETGEAMMDVNKKLAAQRDLPTRRQMMVGSAIVLGGLAAGSARGRNTLQQSKAETQTTGADRARTFLHQEVDFKATPQRIYEALLDSKQFSAFTGMPADISREAGGAFSMFGGMIVGRNVELISNQRIVQAWRPASWDPGVYSVVRFELVKSGAQTKIALDHTGFPEGDFGHLNEGWKERYWQPLEKYLG
jgi:activator of HSP90 ATPase